MYHGVSTPPQHPQMASIVYVPSSQPNPVAYYAAEPVMNPQSIQQLPQHQVSLVYPDTPAQQRMQAPQQQVVIPESFATEATPFYAYQPARHETSVNTSNLVCLVPTVTANNSPQMPMLIQSLGSRSISFHADPALRTQETHATPQAMQQVLTPDYMQVAMETPVPLSQSAIDPAPKTNVMNSSEVCRHYINGRCNRRKCRFLHPDLRSPVMPSHATCTPCDSAPIMKNPSFAQVSPLTPYSSLSTASLNSFSVPPSTQWETILW
ncbi:predicted zinc finger protein [Leishmania donovani]|uniref:Predicted_zinc_finger_protein/GeneDB:LmjF.35.4450 n=1 Tax=Leishmania donovani TaxID=5661 RepID=A0A6J8FMZ3_LEIDO|nr:predicted zinc finger protein [Leishmania donovani]VDZ49090.1 predicted_zinc_finger_protein/GeneDB:LmjF.35.4450 [Leishmania donovani]